MSLAQNLGNRGIALPPARGVLCREPGFVYGSMPSDADAVMLRNRILAAGLAVLAISTINGGAQEGETAITCTNPVSGASWQIMVDYRKATVDSNRANISGAEISWFDPKDGGNYTLDRKSGDLTASVASSTGGYFRHGRCSLEKPR
jgi:hypothetical protein